MPNEPTPDIPPIPFTLSSFFGRGLDDRRQTFERVYMECVFAPNELLGETSESPEGIDMRAKQADGTWKDGDKVCLDRNGYPIVKGTCLYRNLNTSAWCVGRLLGVGKANIWRIRDRFTRRVKTVTSRNLWCRYLGPMGPYRHNLRGTAIQVREQVGGYNTFIQPVYARYLIRAMTLPENKRIPFLVKHYAQPYEKCLRVSVDGELLDVLGHYSVQHDELPPDTIGKLANIDLDHLEFYAAPDDTRYTNCQRCENTVLNQSIRPVHWIQCGFTNSRFPGLCRHCIRTLRDRPVEYLPDGNTARIRITELDTGVWEFRVENVRTEIANPAIVQSYSTNVETALDWVGKDSPFHLGLEIEGYTPDSAKLCSRLYKSGLAIGKSDSSIHPPKANLRGVEVVTPPIGCNPEVYRPALTKLAKILALYEFDSNASCGGHIHISASAMSIGAIARVKYAIAKWPQGWPLIFGREANHYCSTDGAFERYNTRLNISRAGSSIGNGNILDALAINNRGAINPSTRHNTHEFRAFASQHTLTRMLANLETVLAIREWSLSMPTDWTLAGYLKFLQAREGADAYSKGLVHYKGKLASDPFDSLVADMKVSKAPPLFYARALAISALVRIRMARVEANRPASTPKATKPVKVWTVRDEAKKRFQEWNIALPFDYAGLPAIGLDVFVGTANPEPRYRRALVDTRPPDAIYETGLVLMVSEANLARLDAPYTGLAPGTPPRALDRSILTLAI